MMTMAKAKATSKVTPSSLFQYFVSRNSGDSTYCANTLVTGGKQGLVEKVNIQWCFVDLVLY